MLLNIPGCYHFMLIKPVLLLTLYEIRVAKFVVKTERCQSVMAFYWNKHLLVQRVS